MEINLNKVSGVLIMSCIICPWVLGAIDILRMIIDMIAR